MELLHTYQEITVMKIYFEIATPTKESEVP